MKKMVLFFLIIFPFSAFLIPQLDIWHAQGYFIQGAILVLYCTHLFKKNRPIAFFLGWAGLFTLHLFIKLQIQTKQYPINILLPFFNLLNIIIFFDLLTNWIDKETYKKFFKYFTYTFLIVLAYSVIQKLGLDQFYRSIDPSFKDRNNFEIVGIMGNPMHHAHFIVICLPVLFALKGWIRKLAILLTLGCVVLTDSSSGFLIAITIVAFGQVFLRIFTIKEIILWTLLGVDALLWTHGDMQSFMTQFSFSEGRYKIWKDYLPIFQDRPLTGWGMGLVNSIAQQPKFLGWRHLHLEYYHVAVELGLIGLSFVVWGVFDYFKRFILGLKDEVSVITASMFLSFCLCALFGYPAHLWVLSVLGIVAYSYQYLQNEI